MITEKVMIPSRMGQTVDGSQTTRAKMMSGPRDKHSQNPRNEEK